MKKLPLCTLIGGALFAIGGTIALLDLARRPEPLLLFFPLAWDLVMVAIGVGVILRYDCARRAGMVWGVFCLLASLAVGLACFSWLSPQQPDPPDAHRVIFTLLSVGFGVIFGIWQLVAFNGPEMRAWTASERTAAPVASEPHHG